MCIRIPIALLLVLLCGPALCRRPTALPSG